MTDPTPDHTGNLMDPAAFHDLMRTSFGREPAHPGFDADLSRGKRQLRRRHAGQGVAAFATAAMVAATALAMPALGGDEQQLISPAAGAETMTDQEIIDACLNAGLLGGEMLDNSGKLSFEELQPGLQELMAGPELMTSSHTDYGTVATLRSGDGKYWTECNLKEVDSPTDHGYASVYPTGVTFTFDIVDGRRVYEPMNMADTRLEGTATTQAPGVWAPCDMTANEETQEWRDQLAACDVFLVTWNDRRVAEVAKAKIVTPDGVTSLADVKGGYLSFAYAAPMVPAVAEAFRTGRGQQDLIEVTFYDQDDNVLVHDANLGDIPAEGELSIQNYPSLSWWLRD